MSSLINSTCSSCGGTAIDGGDGNGDSDSDTDGGSDCEGDLDLLRDEGGKSDGGDDNDGLQVGVRQVVVEQLMSKQSRCGVT
ncbi:hypothetical protein Tco_0070023 [Tanacetum coccineum]